MSERTGSNLWDRKEQKRQMETCLEMTTPICSETVKAFSSRNIFL